MASSTVLAVVQSFCRLYAMPVPTALQGSSDAGALQMRELIQEVCEYIWRHSDWQECSRRASWASIAGEDQGAISTLFSENFFKIIPSTFWDFTIRQPLQGPISDERWQGMKSLNPQGPLYSFKVTNNRLLVTSTMPAGHTLTLFYKTKNWMTSSGIPGAAFLTDSDTCFFSDHLIKAGMRAFWLRIKQMPHAAEFSQFEDMLMMEASSGTVRPILRMDDSGQSPMYGITIPIGNWAQP